MHVIEDKVPRIIFISIGRVKTSKLCTLKNSMRKKIEVSKQLHIFAGV